MLVTSGPLFRKHHSKESCTGLIFRLFSADTETEYMLGTENKEGEIEEPKYKWFLKVPENI